MSSRAGLTNRIAKALAAHAVRMAHADDAEWTRAMVHEQEQLPAGASSLSWALGCLSVSYRGKLRAMTRSPTPIGRATLLLIILFCLEPACWNFACIVGGAALGHSLFPGGRELPYSLIFGSATLIGPLGVAAAIWMLCSNTHRLGMTFMIVLLAFTAWALHMLKLPAQYPLLTHSDAGFQVPNILLNFVLMPALGVALLLRLNARRGRHSA